MKKRICEIIVFIFTSFVFAENITGFKNLSFNEKMITINKKLIEDGYFVGNIDDAAELKAVSYVKYGHDYFLDEPMELFTIFYSQSNCAVAFNTMYVFDNVDSYTTFLQKLFLKFDNLKPISSSKENGFEDYDFIDKTTGHGLNMNYKVSSGTCYVNLSFIEQSMYTD